MKLIRGNIENLSGNGVIYWDVKGINVISPNSKIIAMNFVISALPIDDKILAANFPPLSFIDYEEFMGKLAHIYCDIIYGGIIIFPNDENFINKFIKAEWRRYNRIVEEYIESYRMKFNFNPSELSEKEQLFLLNDLSKKIRNTMKSGDYTNKNLDSKSNKLSKLVKNIKNKFNKYDLDNFSKILYQPGDKIDTLTELYTKKFIAIYYEDYENANEIEKKIINLENNNN